MRVVIQPDLSYTGFTGVAGVFTRWWNPLIVGIVIGLNQAHVQYEVAGRWPYVLGYCTIKTILPRAYVDWFPLLQPDQYEAAFSVCFRFIRRGLNADRCPGERRAFRVEDCASDGDARRRSHCHR